VQMLPKFEKSTHYYLFAGESVAYQFPPFVLIYRY
jgi:hypothetical protein